MEADPAGGFKTDRAVEPAARFEIRAAFALGDRLAMAFPDKGTEPFESPIKT
jgi:hypothetical protein